MHSLGGKKKKNKSVGFCPKACSKGKCIHGINTDIKSCTFCANSLAAKRRNVYIPSPRSKLKCNILCKSYDCADDEYCLEPDCKENVFEDCPIPCGHSECLHRALLNPDEKIHQDLIPCICDSNEINELYRGPVNTTRKRVKDKREEGQREGRLLSRVILRDTGVFELILREPMAWSHFGWRQRHFEKDYLDGSNFTGDANELGFSGKGQLKMPHGVLYKGNFEEGRFHGDGTLRYPSGIEIEGIWEQGINIAIQHIRFPDGLKYIQPDWKYLNPPERRFYKEYTSGLQPECSLYRTGRELTTTLPEDGYDTGDGYYSPSEKCIFDFNSKEILRVPCKKEVEWIKRNCRYGWRETIGNRIKTN